MAIKFIDSITVDGDVGIGTTSPSKKLDVNGDVTFGTGNKFQTITNALEGVGANGVYLRSAISNAANPSFSNSDDTNTGMFLPGSDVLGLSTAGSERFRITNIGRVGIGTANPLSIFQISDGNPDVYITSADTGQSDIFFGGSTTPTKGNIKYSDNADAMIFKVNTNTEALRIISSGNVGIGATAPISQLHIKKASSPGPIIQLENAAGGSGADTLIRFGDSSENYSYSVGSDDSANSFRISYNGSSYNGAVPGTNDFLIFSTSGNAEIPNGDLKVTLGSIAVGNISNSATDGRIDASNDVVAFSTSDIRLKDNIKSIDKALDKVNSIQGIEFDWIEKEEVHGNSGHDIGVIAQEIEKILPDVVTTRDNGYKAVKYEKIVPLLIEAIKDLSKQVDGLKRLI